MTERRRRLLIAFAMWFGSRLIFWLLAIWGSYHFRSDLHAVSGFAPHPYVLTPNRALDVFARWDALHYLGIAEDGYNVPAMEYRLAFFPGWPLILRAFMALHIDPLLGGVVLNHLILLVAMGLFVLWHEDKSAFELSAVLVVSSATFYWGTLYPEALFLLCVILVMHFGRDRPSLWAAVPSAIASALRPQGMLLSGYLFLLAVEKRTWRLVAASALGASGLVAYMVYQYVTFGDPLGFLHFQARWGRGLTWPWKAFLRFDREPDHYIASILCLVLLGLMVKRRAPLPETMLALLFVLMPLSTGALLSFPRFFLVMVPIQLELLEATTPKWLRWGYLASALIYGVVNSFRLGQGWGFY